jgi:prolyl-tRNA synthetase
MFADMDLIGIPHRFVLGDRGLANNEIEYKNRLAKDSENIAVDQAVEFAKTLK